MELLLKATLVLMAGLLASALARRDASRRHLLLTATLAALALLPALSWTLPPVSVEVPEAIPVRFSASPAPLVLAPLSPLEAALPAAAATPARRLNLLPWLWAAGALLIVTRFAFGLVLLHHLRRTALPARSLGLPPNVLLHGDIAAPVTFGSTVLLPRDAEGWPPDALRRALMHEFEHIRRGDWASHLFAEIVRAAYWFHPLVWVLHRRLALAAEIACDDAVVRSEEGANYADQLVSLAGRMSARRFEPALGMAHRNHLALRVRSILDTSRHRRPAGPIALLATSTAALLMVSALAPLSAVAQSARRAAKPAVSLFHAAERGDTQAVRQSVADGSPVNVVIPGDGTPLIAAARRGHLETVRALLDADADPNLAVHGDGSPLIMAAGNGHKSVVQLLLDRGANINIAVEGDGSPLIMAARAGQLEVVQFLLDRGANIELVVPGDENALIEASAAGQLPVVRFLVSRGANVNARVFSERNGGLGGEWRTPLSRALRFGRTEVAAYLRSVGARE